MSNSVFFPQATLDVLLDQSRIDLDGDQLVLTDGGYRYSVTEAVRIVLEETEGGDPEHLCGKVMSRAELCDDRGAEILGDSLLIEDMAYVVVPGFAGKPIGDVDPAAKPEVEILQLLQAIEA
ncbi:MAG: hypothetical protein DRI90_06540 [Deltaproteobacteria bacterium]|nr:MAG: hypothetical protein DRI90_06540 [Deltaproteobacteria bacterium]